MAKILVVEDDPKMRAGLRDNLEFEGYDVEAVGDGKTGLEKAIGSEYDLLLLDVMLPGMSGFDVLRTVRERGIQVPTIMLTAKGEEIDKVLGLELGADDYVTKPFGLRELLARVKAVLRRHEQTGEKETAERARVGTLEVDFAAYSATKGGKPVAMTPKEIEILKYFWQHRNETVSRDKLLTDVWGYDDSVSTRTVDNFILKLRQKIEKDPASPRHIITIHGIGYKLLA
ncbi:DNA-binding response regulator [bacterium]|nr:MAG: DNA-binding response regulator [bacterium]